MSDYIKREDAIQSIVEHDVAKDEGSKEWAIWLLENAKPADVVEVVRCKDCKWWDGNDCKARDIDVVDVDDFCSYGEKKNE